MRRRAIAIAGTLALGLGGAAAVTWCLTQVAGWGPPSTSTQLASPRADVFFLNVPQIVQRGPPRLVVVRLEGPAQLVPHHYSQAGLPGPQTVEEWARHLGAPVVFNAGQFDEKLQYLGWLKADDRWLSSQRKAGWMGLLVSGPHDGGAWGRIVDLQQADPNVVDRYRHVLQSMMLVDDAARVRVRHTDRAACRTVVAEDRRGRLLILATEGAVTLQDLATWLPQSGLDIVRAMNLDGGIESQLAIDTPELRLALYGQYAREASMLELRGPMVRYPLPAVVAVESP